MEEVLKTQNSAVIIIETRMFMTSKQEFKQREDLAAFVRNVTDNVKYSSSRTKLIMEIKL